MATQILQNGKEYEVSETMAVCLENLAARGFVARYYPTRQEAREAMLAEIRLDETIGIGGSKTIDELDVYDALRERGNRIFWHWRNDEEGDIRRNALLSDCYLCSANALMDSGELVSIDGGGNRVAAMFYGPKRCIIVCGQNKLVSGGYDAAIERIKTIACPKNARRLDMKTPGAKTDRCHECPANLRMCRVTVRYSYPMGGRETHVWVIGEDMGF